MTQSTRNPSRDVTILDARCAMFRVVNHDRVVAPSCEGMFAQNNAASACGRIRE